MARKVSIRYSRQREKNLFILSEAAYIRSAEAVKRDDRSDRPTEKIEHFGPDYLQAEGWSVVDLAPVA